MRPASSGNTLPNSCLNFPECEIEPDETLKKMGIKGRHWNCGVMEDREDHGQEWEEHTEASFSVWHFNSIYQGIVTEFVNSIVVLAASHIM
jgi:hypothetical protein